MPTFRQADWYETPHYYDILLAPDTERDGDFLEAVHARHGLTKGHRVLEPACGSGRLLVEMAGRGYAVVGLDLSEEMVRYAQDELAAAGLQGDVLQAQMQAFDLPGRFDLAHCLISTFKYLLDETAAAAALRCVARSLRPGGIFVLGLHLTDYAEKGRQRERWVGRRGRTRVVCNLQSWPADRRRRRERVRSRLTTIERGVTERTETNWEFRTYDGAQIGRLLRSVPEFEHVATHDFSYDLEREVHEDQLDRVYVLRRRARPGSRSSRPSSQSPQRRRR